MTAVYTRKKTGQLRVLVQQNLVLLPSWLMFQGVTSNILELVSILLYHINKKRYTLLLIGPVCIYEGKHTRARPTVRMHFVAI